MKPDMIIIEYPPQLQMTLEKILSLPVKSEYDVVNLSFVFLSIFMLFILTQQCDFERYTFLLNRNDE